MFIIWKDKIPLSPHLITIYLCRWQGWETSMYPWGQIILQWPAIYRKAFDVCLLVELHGLLLTIDISLITRMDTLIMNNKMSLSIIPSRCSLLTILSQNSIFKRSFKHFNLFIGFWQKATLLLYIKKHLWSTFRTDTHRQHGHSD